MNCSEAREKLSELLDGYLTFEEEDRLKEHLLECPRCSREYERLKELVGILNGLPEEDPGEQFCEQVLEKVRQIQEGAYVPVEVREPWFEPLKRFLAGLWPKPAVALAVGLLAGAMVMSQMGAEDGGAVSREAMASFSRGAPSPTAAPYVDSRASSPAAVAEGPLADLDLSSLSSSGTDSVVDEPEYVLEPYVVGPKGTLRPVGYEVVKRVKANLGESGDGYVTF